MKKTGAIFNFRQAFSIAAICGILAFLIAGIGQKVTTAGADEGPATLSMAAPYGTESDTFAINTLDSISRAIDIRGALRIALIFPTTGALTTELLVSQDPDSTFQTLQWIHSAADSAIAWHLHSGTGAFGIDLTDLLTGFNYFKATMSDTPSVIRTFHYTMKR